MAAVFATPELAKFNVVDVNGSELGVRVSTTDRTGEARGAGGGGDGGAGIGVPGVRPERYSTAAPTFRRFVPTTLPDNPRTESPYDMIIVLIS